MQTTRAPETPRLVPRRRLIGVATGIATMLALVVIGFGMRLIARDDAGLFSPAAAEGFFSRYVSDAGQVERPEDGDTVSEGQAYAMLLAVALDDPHRFARVWRWTKDNLQRPDALLSWRWANGSIVDVESAADADVDAAHALALAGERFGEQTYSEEAERMADAILENEVLSAGRRRVLVAGPWAVGRRITNPSYFAPVAFERFAAFDPAWDAVRATSLDIAAQLTEGGEALPPDWASVDQEGTAHPTGRPDAGSAAGYGLDAPRMVIRFAASCDGRARALSARAWDRFAGTTWGADSHPIDVVTAAAAAHAAGMTSDRDRLLKHAERIAAGRPSYYGSAWAALGPAMLDEDALACS